MDGDQPIDLVLRSFVVVESAIVYAEAGPAPAVVSVPLTEVCGDLLELFGGVGDGRCDQGGDHPVAVVLALSAAAVVSGMTSYTVIAGWVQDVPVAILADLDLRTGAKPVGPPSKTTIWRVLSGADAEAFDAAIGTWLAQLAERTLPAPAVGEESMPWVQVRLDGKTGVFDLLCKRVT